MDKGVISISFASDELDDMLNDEVDEVDEIETL